MLLSWVKVANPSSHLKTGRSVALSCWPYRLPQRATARAV